MHKTRHDGGWRGNTKINKSHFHLQRFKDKATNSNNALMVMITIPC